MHRRDLLTAAAATTVTGLAGCLAGGSGDSGDGEGNGSDDASGGGGESPPEVTGSSIETRGTECASESAGEATAERESDTIAVDGVIGASDTCHDAVLGDVEIHNRQLVLSVDVESRGGACIECVSAVDYAAEVTVSNAGGLHGVTVEHVGGDEHVTNWDEPANASP